MAKVTSILYDTLIRSNARFLTTVFASAFAFQLAYDSGTEKLWDYVNKGRQWKDIKQRYLQNDNDDDE